MKLLILLCLVALSVAVRRPAQILSSKYDSDGVGRYNWRYLQTDGQAQEQQGELKNAGTKDEYITVKGSYSWVSPDFILYRVIYVADEKGYQPKIVAGPGLGGGGGGGLGGGFPPAVVASLLG